MIVGVPKEIKPNEHRVGITPSAVEYHPHVCVIWDGPKAIVSTLTLQSGVALKHLAAMPGRVDRPSPTMLISAASSI